MSVPISSATPTHIQSDLSTQQTATLTINGTTYSVKVFVGDSEKTLTASKIEQLRSAILDAIGEFESCASSTKLDANKFTVECKASDDANLALDGSSHKLTQEKAAAVWQAVHGDASSVTQGQEIDSHIEVERLFQGTVQINGYSFNYGPVEEKAPEGALLFQYDAKDYYVKPDQTFPKSLAARLEHELDLAGGDPQIKLLNSVPKLFHSEKKCRVGVANTAVDGSTGGIVGINKQNAQAPTVHVQCTLLKENASPPENAYTLTEGNCTYAVTVGGKGKDAIAQLLDGVNIDAIQGSVPIDITEKLEKALQAETTHTSAAPEAETASTEEPSEMSRPASPTESVRAFSSVTLPDGFSVTHVNTEMYQEAEQFFNNMRKKDDFSYALKNAVGTNYFVYRDGGYQRIVNTEDLKKLSQDEKDRILCCKIPVTEKRVDKDKDMLNGNQAFSLLGIFNSYTHTFADKEDFECALHAAYNIVRDTPDMALDSKACASEFIKKMAEFEPMSQEEENTSTRKTLYDDDVSVGGRTIHLSDFLDDPIQASSFERMLNYCGNDPDKVTGLLEQYNASSPISLVKEVDVHYDIASNQVFEQPTQDTSIISVRLDSLQRIDDVRAGLEALRNNQKKEGATEYNAETIPKLLKDAIAEVKQDRGG